MLQKFPTGRIQDAMPSYDTDYDKKNDRLKFFVV